MTLLSWQSDEDRSLAYLPDDPEVAATARQIAGRTPLRPTRRRHVRRLLVAVHSMLLAVGALIEAGHLIIAAPPLFRAIGCAVVLAVSGALALALGPLTAAFLIAVLAVPARRWR